MPFLQTFARTFLAGKRLVTYIFPFTDFWASRVYYLDTYTVNLELDDNFNVFYDLVYLYIFIFYRSRPSCNWATYPEAILVNICTLVYFSSKVIVLIIKSHDKYQSLILIGLARAEMASSGNRSVLVHYRSYWREWRPLVTPWACCIKEGIEPWKSERWLFTSHVQHPHPAPGVLEVRSITLLDHLRADQQIPLDERSIDSWQLYLDQSPLQAGLQP